MPTLALGSAADSTGLDSVAFQTKLTNFANAVSEIGAYCNAMRYTNLAKVDPAPDWFAPLSSHVDSIKKQAQNWLDNIQPAMPGVPQAIIGYGNTFVGQSGTIAEILAQIGLNTPTPAQKKNLVTELGALYQRVDTMLQSTQAINGQLTQFNADLTNDFNALTSGANSITNDLSNDKAAVTTLTQDIEDLKATVKNLKHDITVEDWLEAGSVVLGGVAVLLFLVTDGTAAVFIIPIAALGIATTTPKLIALEKDVKEAQGKLLSDTSQLTGTDQQIVQLNAVAATVKGLVGKNKEAGAVMQDILTTWSTLGTKTKSVVDDIETAEGDIGSILDAGDVTSAQTAWTQLTTFATQVQAALGNVTSEPPVNIITTGGATA